MTRKEIDILWSRALHDSVVAGEEFTRYRFAEMIEAAERERCITACNQFKSRAEKRLKISNKADKDFHLGEICGAEDCISGIQI